MTTQSSTDTDKWGYSIDLFLDKKTVYHTNDITAKLKERGLVFVDKIWNFAGSNIGTWLRGRQGRLYNQMVYGTETIALSEGIRLLAAGRRPTTGYVIIISDVKEADGIRLQVVIYRDSLSPYLLDTQERFISLLPAKNGIYERTGSKEEMSVFSNVIHLLKKTVIPMLPEINEILQHQNIDPELLITKLYQLL